MAQRTPVNISFFSEAEFQVGLVAHQVNKAYQMVRRGAVCVSWTAENSCSRKDMLI